MRFSSPRLVGGLLSLVPTKRNSNRLQISKHHAFSAYRVSAQQMGKTVALDDVPIHQVSLFQLLVLFFQHKALKLPPPKPCATSAFFMDTRVSSPRPLPVVNGTKSTCKWGMASSMYRKSAHTLNCGLRSSNIRINSFSTVLACSPSVGPHGGLDVSDLEDNLWYSLM